MALTDKKRRFADALMSGASNRDAAIQAGYSEKTASQAGSKLAKAREAGARIIAIGILPTIRPEHFQGEWISDNNRYTALNDSIFVARGEDIVIESRPRLEGRQDVPHEVPHRRGQADLADRLAPAEHRGHDGGQHARQRRPVHVVRGEPGQQRERDQVAGPRAAVERLDGHGRAVRRGHDEDAVRARLGEQAELAHHHGVGARLPVDGPRVLEHRRGDGGRVRIRVGAAGRRGDPRRRAGSAQAGAAMYWRMRSRSQA